MTFQQRLLHPSLAVNPQVHTVFVAVAALQLARYASIRGGWLRWLGSFSPRLKLNLFLR